MPKKTYAKVSPTSDLQHSLQPYIRGHHAPPLNTPQTFAPFKKPKTQMDL